MIRPLAVSPRPRVIVETEDISLSSTASKNREVIFSQFLSISSGMSTTRPEGDSPARGGLEGCRNRHGTRFFVPSVA